MRSETYERRANRRSLLGMLFLTLSAACVWCLGWSAMQQIASLAIASAVMTVIAFIAASYASARARYWAMRADNERGFQVLETLRDPRWHAATNNDNN